MQLYASEREDANSSAAAVIALCSAWLALLGVLGFALEQGGGSHGWLLAFLPLVPLPLAGIGALALVRGEIRAKLLTALEAELIRSGLRADGIPAPSNETLFLGLWLPGRFRRPALGIYLGWIYLPLMGIYLSLSVWSLVLAWQRTDAPIAIFGMALFAIADALFADLLWVYLKRFKSRPWPEQAHAVLDSVISVSTSR